MSANERWDALSDALAIDVPVDAEDREFVERHDDPHARREREVYAALRVQGEPGALSPADRRRAEVTLAEFRSRSRSGAPRWVWGLGAAAIAVAAAVTLWMARPTATMVTPQRKAAVVASGSLMLDAVELVAGDAIPVDRWVVARDRSCVDAGVGRGCVSPASRLRVTPQHLELAEGSVSVEGSAVVLTSQGQISAHDARMRVWIDGQGAHVEVESGQVAVQATDGRAWIVEPGERDGLAPQALAQRTPSTMADDRLDADAPGPKVEEAIAKPDVARTADGPGVARRPASRLSAGDLLGAARRHVAAGHSARALAVYADLRRQHPRSSEAHAANVSIGELELRRGHARAALRAFGRYLTGGGGPLAEEAHWGKIRALHRLGEGSRRDAAVQALVIAHPSSVYLSRASAL